MNQMHAFWYALWLALAVPQLAAVLGPALGVAALYCRPARRLLIAGALGAAGACAALFLNAPMFQELGHPPPARLHARFMLLLMADPEPRGNGEIAPCREADAHALTELRIIRGRVPGLAQGAWIEVAGEREAIPGRRNPGAPDFAALARGRGIASRVRVLSATDVRVARTASPVRIAGAAWRDSLRADLSRGLGPRAGPYGVALLFGETSAIPDDQMDGLVALGIIHIAIVAGLHLHMAHAMARWATSRLPWGLSRGISLGVTLAYG